MMDVIDDELSIIDGVTKTPPDEELLINIESGATLENGEDGKRPSRILDMVKDDAEPVPEASEIFYFGFCNVKILKCDTSGPEVTHDRYGRYNNYLMPISFCTSASFFFFSNSS